VVRTVFVANDPRQRDLAEARHAATLVGLAEEGVHALQHALGDAGHLAEPNRGAEDQDVAVEDALADVGPGVPVPLVRCNAGLDVMIGDADRFSDFDAALAQFASDQIDHLVG